MPANDPGYYWYNYQDVGGQTKDNFKAIGQGYEDAVDVPLSLAIKKAQKPVKHWCENSFLKVGKTLRKLRTDRYGRVRVPETVADLSKAFA